MAHRDIVAYADIGQYYGQHLPSGYQAVAVAGLVPGAATGLYWSLDKETGKFDMAAAVPFTGDAPENLPEGFEIVEVPESQALSTDYYGPYDNLSEAHDAIDVYISAEEMEPPFLVVEEYITDPTWWYRGLLQSRAHPSFSRSASALQRHRVAKTLNATPRCRAISFTQAASDSRSLNKSGISSVPSRD